MRKLIIISLVFLMLVCMGFFTLARSADTYKIGAAFPLTGPAQFFGDAERLAMDLALEEINAKGGVNGQKLEIVYMDTKAEVNQAMSVVEKLISQYNVPVIVTTDSNSALGTMDITEKAKVVHISVARADLFTKKGYSYCFRNQPTNELLMEQFLKDLSTKLHTKKLAILVANYPYGLSALDALEKFKIPSIEVVYSNKFPMETADFTPYLTAVKGSGADTLLTILTERHAIGIITRYRELGLDKAKIRLTGDDHLLEKAVLDAVGDKAEGAITQLVYHKSFNKVAETFNNTFAKKYGYPPGSILHALGYADVYAVFYGLKAAGTNSDTTALANALRKIRFDSPLGTNLYFDSTGQLIGAAGNLAQFVKGEFVIDTKKWIKP
jgi:branched-chain amino acid transport system substrate-binding protein